MVLITRVLSRPIVAKSVKDIGKSQVLRRALHIIVRMRREDRARRADAE
jgi:hypothetical protein